MAIAFALAVLWRRPTIFIATAAAVYSSDLLTSAIKAVVHRHRPFEHQIGPSERTHSFPSGHSATSFAGAVLLSAFAPRFRAFFFALAVLIAFSRLYNGVHYPTDVLAGAVLGTVIGLATLRLLRVRSPR